MTLQAIGATTATVGAALEIARRDLRRLFSTPLAWCALAAVQLVLGLFFFIVFLWGFDARQPMLVAARSSFGLTALVAAPLLKSAALILALLTPLLAMRSLADERRAGTLALTLSSPVSVTGIVLGKYLALLAFLALQCALIALMPLSLALGGTLDTGLVASALLGLCASAAAFAAVGLWASSLTRQPATAEVSTLQVQVDPDSSEIQPRNVSGKHWLLSATPSASGDRIGDRAGRAARAVVRGRGRRP